MSSNAFNKPLRLARKPSRLLATYLVLLYLLAFVATGLAGIPLLFKFGSALLLLIGGFTHYHWYQLHSHDAKTFWVWQSDANWIEDIAGRLQSWSLQPGYVITPWFIMLVLGNAAGKKRRLLLIRDQTDRDTFRRLSVRLGCYKELTMDGDKARS